MKITKKTYDKNVKKFAKQATDNWKKLEAFAKNLKLDDKHLEELCKIVDDYCAMDMQVLDYAYKNGIDLDDFCCDVANASGIEVSFQS